MIEEIRELFQMLIVPQLEGIKGEIKALDARMGALDDKMTANVETLHTKIDGKFGQLDAKVDLKFAQLDAKIDMLDVKIDTVESRMESKLGEIKVGQSVIDAFRRELLAEIHRVEATLSSDFVRIEEKVDTRLLTMNEKLDLHRRELLAEIRAASK